jgi:hypothetical protein
MAREVSCTSRAISSAGPVNSVGVGLMPRASATVAWAASSSVAAVCQGQCSWEAKPEKWMTQGFPRRASCPWRCCQVDAPGGLPSTHTTSVSGSAAKIFKTCPIIRPPTSSERSRPPTPMACEIPSPAAVIRQDTSCRPVPEAAANPIRPRPTTFAKPRGVPLIIAVPQSGPIMSRPLERASRLSSISVDRGTLSLKSMTCNPARKAFRASNPACMPGTEMSTRLALSSTLRADCNVRGRGVAWAAGAEGREAVSAASAASAPARAADASASMAMIRSLGEAVSPSAVSNPASARSVRFEGVPIMAAARRTPSTSSRSRVKRMSVTESWYTPLRR